MSSLARKLTLPFKSRKKRADAMLPGGGKSKVSGSMCQTGQHYHLKWIETIGVVYVQCLQEMDVSRQPHGVFFYQSTSSKSWWPSGGLIGTSFTRCPLPKKRSRCTCSFFLLHASIRQCNSTYKAHWPGFLSDAYVASH